MNDQGMTEEEANYHFERIIAENTLTLFDLKAKLTEAERVRDESTLELTEIAYAIGGHGTALSQVKALKVERDQLYKENLAFQALLKIHGIVERLENESA